MAFARAAFKKRAGAQATVGQRGKTIGCEAAPRGLGGFLRLLVEGRQPRPAAAAACHQALVALFSVRSA
jgi:hypothetical protein